MLHGQVQSAADTQRVDAWRREICKLFNAFATCIQHRGPSEHLLRLALRGMMNHAQTHFAEEQALMLAAGVDVRHVAKHQMEHRSFTYDVEQLLAQLDVVTCEGVARATEKLLRFMSIWLMRHVMVTDQAMSTQIAAIKHGISADAAFVLGQSSRPAATSPREFPEPAHGRMTGTPADCRQLAQRLEALAAISKRGEERKRRAA